MTKDGLKGNMGRGLRPDPPRCHQAVIKKIEGPYTVHVVIGDS